MVKDKADTAMMHECPKCNFVQPIDRYCANCGLDIENYHPSPKPFFQRLFHSTAFQVGVAVGLILAMALYIGLRDRKVLTEALNVSTFPTTPDGEQPAVESNLQQDQGLAQSQDALVEDTAAPSATAADSVKTSPPTTAPTQLQVSFVEIRKTLVQQLSTEGQILSESDVIRTVSVPSINGTQELRDRDPDTELLPGGDTETMRPGTPILFDFTHISPTDGQDLGLQIQVTPTNITPQIVDIELSTTLNIVDRSGRPLNTQQLNGSFSFMPKSTLFIFGLLPRQGLRLEDRDIFVNTPLSIYSRPEFANNISEFAIMIMAK